MAENVVIRHKSKYQLIAKVAGQEAGYLRFSYTGDEAQKRAMELEWVEVYPKFRGLGVGTKLIKYFLKEVKEKYPSVIWVSLWTGKELEKSGHSNLYQNVGFKLLVTQRDYYDKGVHCRLYAKKVHPGFQPPEKKKKRSTQKKRVTKARRATSKLLKRQQRRVKSRSK